MKKMKEKVIAIKRLGFGSRVSYSVCMYPLSIGYDTYEM